MSITLVLVVAATVCTILAAAGTRVPLWVGVLLLCLASLLTGRV